MGKKTFESIFAVFQLLFKYLNRVVRLSQICSSTDWPFKNPVLKCLVLQFFHAGSNGIEIRAGNNALSCKSFCLTNAQERKSKIWPPVSTAVCFYIKGVSFLCKEGKFGGCADEGHRARIFVTYSECKLVCCPDWARIAKCLGCLPNGSYKQKIWILNL